MSGMRPQSTETRLQADWFQGSSIASFFLALDNLGLGSDVELVNLASPRRLTTYSRTIENCLLLTSEGQLPHLKVGRLDRPGGSGTPNGRAPLEKLGNIGKKGWDRASQPIEWTLVCALYFSPPAALLPHIALAAQTVPNPLEVLEPHIAEDPHMADEPHIAELAEVNCVAPQTAELPHIAEEPQTEDESKTM